MRILAVDFGERRIGLALSDPERRLALPLAAVERRSDAQAIAAIADLARRQEVGLLVVGEPLRLDGSRGPAAHRAARFAARLAAACALPLRLIPETLTTVEAHARLRAAGIDGSRRTGRLDAVAAQLLLEEALAREAAAGAEGAEDRPARPAAPSPPAAREDPR